MQHQNVVEIFSVAVVHVGCGIGRTFHFQRAADQIGLLDFLGIYAGGSGAGLGYDVDQVFVTQFFYSFAHGCAGDIELKCDGFFVDGITRFDFTCENQIADQRIDLVAHGATAIQFGAREHGFGRTHHECEAPSAFSEAKVNARPIVKRRTETAI
jgi:hypothetical protein